MKKLDFAETLKDSIAIGVKNAPSVVVAVALWLVTIWIPYINIGTTIAISLLPVELAKGSVINPLGIFDSKYRRYMGEYLITAGLMVIPIYIAFVFMIVPGIVAVPVMGAFVLFPARQGQKTDAGHQGVERRDVRQQVDDVSRDAGIRHHGGHRVRHLVRHLSGHQRRLHHLPRHVRPDRARGFGPDGDRRIVLETAERQRGISLRHYFPKTACGSSFFV